MGDVAIRVATSSTAPLTIGDVRNALWGRRSPDAIGIGNLVGKRYGFDAGDALGRALAATAPAPSTTRIMTRSELPSLRTWRSFLRLVQAITLAQKNGLSQQQAAEAIRVGWKSLSARCGPLCGLTWRELTALPAWEGVVEWFIRRFQSRRVALRGVSAVAQE